MLINYIAIKEAIFSFKLIRKFLIYSFDFCTPFDVECLTLTWYLSDRASPTVVMKNPNETWKVRCLENKVLIHRTKCSTYLPEKYQTWTSVIFGNEIRKKTVKQPKLTRVAFLCFLSFLFWQMKPLLCGAVRISRDVHTCLICAFYPELSQQRPPSLSVRLLFCEITFQVLPCLIVEVSLWFLEVLKST